MNEFIAICEYFEISPKDFFDGNTANPALAQKLLKEVSGLPDRDMELLLEVAEKFKK